SEAVEIVDFMRDAWKLPTPGIIISVTGGAALFEIPSPRIRKLLRQDLVAAAVSTNAWIFTGGTNSGVMKEVGDAFHACRYKGTKTTWKIPCIGIADWYATIGQAYHLYYRLSYTDRADSH
ncbi:unnamed protein product, partial [Rotaria sp. Silwood1]